MVAVWQMSYKGAMMQDYWSTLVDSYGSIHLVYNLLRSELQRNTQSSHDAKSSA